MTAVKEKLIWTIGFCMLPCLNTFHKLKTDPQAFHGSPFLGKGQQQHLLLRQGDNTRLVVCRPGLEPLWPRLISVCLFSWFYQLVWSGLRAPVTSLDLPVSIFLILQISLIGTIPGANFLSGNWRLEERIRGDSGSAGAMPTALPPENFEEMYIWGPRRSTESLF